MSECDQDPESIADMSDMIEFEPQEFGAGISGGVWANLVPEIT